MANTLQRQRRTARNVAAMGTVQERAERVLSVLRERPDDLWQVTELADRTGMPPGPVGAVLGMLKDRGEVSRDGRKGWRARG